MARSRLTGMPVITDTMARLTGAAVAWPLAAGAQQPAMP
jgi:hypothetical protein